MVVASLRFCFSRAYHASTNLKKVFKFKTPQVYSYLPIPSSAGTWKIVTKKVCQSFFRLS